MDLNLSSFLIPVMPVDTGVLFRKFSVKYLPIENYLNEKEMLRLYLFIKNLNVEKNYKRSVQGFVIVTCSRISSERKNELKTFGSY